ncbi:hypothetical protein EVAR_8682_1 [Eumeta japonica]|uniref:Uncharacterized protein n=1 Tax=Eumeta variegata TaxID=151549 RepID=A0A4C1TUY3_EUMVA|nr:hypothetical protein EVAR_8682_1 [Eumeta japonica]
MPNSHEETDEIVAPKRTFINDVYFSFNSDRFLRAFASNALAAERETPDNERERGRPAIIPHRRRSAVGEVTKVVRARLRAAGRGYLTEDIRKKLLTYI